MKFQILSLLVLAISVASEDDKNSKTEKRGLYDLAYGFDHNYGYSNLEDGHHAQVKVPVPQHYAVHIEKKVPIPVKVPVPVHIEKSYPVPVPKPYPVYIEKKVPYPVIKHVPVPVKVPVKVPVTVLQPIYVPRPYPVKVPVSQPYPVKVPVFLQNRTPLFIKDHHYEQGHDGVVYGVHH